MRTIDYQGVTYKLPFSERFRRHTKPERHLLQTSIAENGIKQPVLVYEDTEHGDDCILDGEGRLTAASGMNGVTVPFKKIGRMTTAEAYEQAKIYNDHRRQDDPETIQKRRKERIERVAEARSEGQSLRTIAENEGVSEKQIREDLKKKSTAEGSAVEPEKVKGKDGKSRPARKKKDKDAASPEPVKQSGDYEPAKETKVQPQVDGWGIQLQEHAIEPFQAVPEFDALIKYLKVAQRMLSELADKQGGRFLQKRCQWYRTGKDEDGNEKGRWRMPELDNAVRNIEDTKPTYTTCPYAHNPEKQHPDDCTACRGAYWCPPLSKQIPPNLIENAKRDLGALITEAPSV